MTNKPMLSVELRAFLEGVVKLCAVHGPTYNELRALLDKEADGDSHAPKCQGEPVVYTTAGMLEIAKRLPLTGRICAKATKDERWNIPLFLGQAEQPAPAVVAMPERKPQDLSRDDQPMADWFEEVGYNKALDDVARLNGVKP